eukprot:scaffold559_cov358-Prasinococcus_capsulatus_cf.AAC.9
MVHRRHAIRPGVAWAAARCRWRKCNCKSKRPGWRHAVVTLLQQAPHHRKTLASSSRSGPRPCSAVVAAVAVVVPVAVAIAPVPVAAVAVPVAVAVAVAVVAPVSVIAVPVGPLSVAAAALVVAVAVVVGAAGALVGVLRHPARPLAVVGAAARRGRGARLRLELGELLRDLHVGDVHLAAEVVRHAHVRVQLREEGATHVAHVQLLVLARGSSSALLTALAAALSAALAAAGGAHGCGAQLLGLAEELLGEVHLALLAGLLGLGHLGGDGGGRLGRDGGLFLLLLARGDRLPALARHLLEVRQRRFGLGAGALGHHLSHLVLELHRRRLRGALVLQRHHLALQLQDARRQLLRLRKLRQHLR